MHAGNMLLTILNLIFQIQILVLSPRIKVKRKKLKKKNPGVLHITKFLVAKLDCALQPRL